MLAAGGEVIGVIPRALAEREVALSELPDLRAALGGSLALKVRAGKGFKQRLVPYGPQEWGLALVEACVTLRAIMYQ